MLNKEICRECVIKRHMRAGMSEAYLRKWTSVNGWESDFDNGLLTHCPKTGFSVSVEDELKLKKCPYILEHLVSSD